VYLSRQGSVQRALSRRYQCTVIRNDKPEFKSRVLITTLIKHLRNNVNNCYIARWYEHMLTKHKIAGSNPTTDQVFFKYINHVVQYYDVS
ncbi:unnamed protein product, partial [Callosobruchus maculatus]